MSGQIVDVLLLVNADRLLANPNDVPGAVSLVVSNDLVDKAATGNELNGGNELWFDVKVDDNIRWRATTLSRNFDTTALITNVSQGKPINPQDGLIDTPSFKTLYEVPVAYLKGVTSPSQVTVGSTPVTYTEWQTTAEKPGKLWYTITFILLNRDLQQLPVATKSFTWDPYITITK